MEKNPQSPHISTHPSLLLPQPPPPPVFPPHSTNITLRKRERQVSTNGTTEPDRANKRQTRRRLAAGVEASSRVEDDDDERENRSKVQEWLRSLPAMASTGFTSDVDMEERDEEETPTELGDEMSQVHSDLMADHGEEEERAGERYSASGGGPQQSSLDVGSQSTSGIPRFGEYTGMHQV